ncbi:MAG: M23 family metallopeptidase [Alphaproteobacteria bacterium]|nr:M23 family metallopeptidase [Alphaproteobacteria bacterium]
MRPGQTPQERAAAIGPIAGDVSAKGNRAAGADLAGRAGPTRKAKARKGKRVEYAEPAAQPPAHQAAASTRASAGEPKVPPRSGSRFAWPVKGDVTQSFGRQAGGLRNDGITIRAKAGSDIRAAENGLVIFAGQGSKTSGQVVLLKHADNWITTYSPMSEIKVRRGQVVKKGEALGRVAPSTGSQPGQLQFQARHDGVPVDPIDRLSARSQVAAR